MDGQSVSQFFSLFSLLTGEGGSEGGEKKERPLPTERNKEKKITHPDRRDDS